MVDVNIQEHMLKTLMMQLHVVTTASGGFQWIGLQCKLMCRFICCFNCACVLSLVWLGKQNGVHTLRFPHPHC